MKYFTNPGSKLYIGFLIVVFVFTQVIAVKPAEAFIVYDPSNFVQNTITAIATPVSAFMETSQYAGLSLTGPAQVQAAANAAITTGCDVGTSAIEQGSGFMNSVAGGFSLVTGGVSEAAKLAPMVAALQTRVTCFTALENAIRVQIATGVFENQQTVLAPLLVSTTVKREQAQKRLNDAQALMNATVKSIWRAIAVKVGLSLFKHYSTKYATALLNRFKVPDHLAVDQALSVFYTFEELRRNHTPEDQIILRSILKSSDSGSSADRRTANGLIDMQTQRGLDSCINSSAGVEASIACYGTMENISPMLSLIKVDLAENARSGGQAAAKSESASNQGFLSRRTCKSTVPEQRAIDAQTKGASQAYRDARKVADELEKAQKDAGIYDSESAREQRQVAYDAELDRYSELENLVVSLSPTSSEPKKSPLLSICDVEQGIKAPGAWIAKTGTDMIKNVLEQNADFKSDNIPAALSGMADLFTGMVTKLIDGSGPSGATILDQSLGLVGQGINESLTKIRTVPPTSATGNPGDAIKFYFTPNPVAAGAEYAIVVEIPKLKSISCPCQIDLFAPDGTKEDSMPNGNIGQNKFFFDAPAANEFSQNEAAITYNVRIIYGANGTKYTKYETVRVLVRKSNTVAGLFTDVPSVRLR